eukprot:7384893-Prymnesium_polylepis.1
MEVRRDWSPSPPRRCATTVGRRAASPERRRALTDDDAAKSLFTCLAVVGSNDSTVSPRPTDSAMTRAAKRSPLI